MTEPQLRADALKLPSVLMQGITHMAPVCSVVLSMQLVAQHARLAAPLAFAIAFGIVLTLGISLSQLARHISSAGGYYAYVSRTVHPRAGFLTAWLYFLYDPVCAGINLAYLGDLIEQTAWNKFHVYVPWWAVLTGSALLITLLTYRGIKISTESLTVLGLLEIGILLALSVAALCRPGPGGVNLVPYVPSQAPSAGGLCLGVVFAIMAFSGFESVAPLAEEAQHSRRNLPRAILGSILLIGVLYLFTSWTVMVGWGTRAVDGLVFSTQNPVLLLADRLLPFGELLMALALLNSVLAVSIASTNAATRVFYAMGRTGALPRSLARVHPRFQTPVNAVWLQALITLVLGLGLGFWLGPFREFEFMSVALTLALLIVYGGGNVGVMLYFLRERRAEFRLLLHGVCPVVSSLAIIAVAYFSIFPLPDAPLRYAPLLVVVWLALGIGLLALSRATGREQKLLRTRTAENAA
jgi:amino acid transporter